MKIVENNLGSENMTTSGEVVVVAVEVSVFESSGTFKTRAHVGEDLSIENIFRGVEREEDEARIDWTQRDNDMSTRHIVATLWNVFRDSHVLLM